MGCCQSGGVPTGNESSKLKSGDAQNPTVLILGPSYSGKSTIFRQMVGINMERRNYAQQVYHQILTSMKRLVEARDDEYSTLSDDNKELLSNMEFSESILDSVDFIKEQSKYVDSIDEALKMHLNRLWKDPTVQKLFQLRSKLYVPDSTAYFMNELDRIASDEDKFAPTETDVLQVFYPTTAAVERLIEKNGRNYKILDVGGLRAERKKWVHYFEERLDVIVYVASLSCYNEILYEDSDKNVMHEALALFENQINNRAFEHVSWVLILNKKDLFAEKIKNESIKEAFPNYDGRNDYNACVEFISNQFKSKNKKNRNLSVHITNALKESDITMILNQITDAAMNKGAADVYAD